MSYKIMLLTSLLWIIITTMILYFHENNNKWMSRFIPGSNKHDIDLQQSSAFQHNQPSWAYKLDFMIQPQYIQESQRICYVHVGKTAGSTLSCYLGFNYDHCATGANDTISTNIPDSDTLLDAYDTLQNNIIPYKTLILPNYTTSMIHRDVDTCSEDNAVSNFLFIVRNPYARIQSWFQYERVSINDTNISEERKNDKNSLYYNNKPLFIDCKFYTLNDLGGLKGLGNYNTTLCSRRAFRAITGIFGYRIHNKYNYEYYYKKVLSIQSSFTNSKKFIIRTEHINDDWISIENSLSFGNNNNVNGNDAPTILNNISFAHKNKTPKKYEDNFISDDSKNNICIALCNEIQYYKLILQSAENLDKASYSTSIHELAQDCPNQVAVDTCS